MIINHGLNEYIISIDIAKKEDRTVIAIGQKANEFTGDGRVTSFLNVLDMQMIEHLSYPDLARYIKRLDLNADLHGNNDLLVDSTGVGEAVCDLLEDIGLSPERIIFTGGDTSRISGQKNAAGFITRMQTNVPKHELVDTLQMCLQERRIRLAEGIPFEQDIRKQFSHFVGVMSKSKNMIYNNDSDDVHDDIVCAMAMMAWHFMQSDGARKDFLFEPELAEDKSISLSWSESVDYDFDSSI